MQFHTLILTPWMQPHRVITWQDAIGDLLDGDIEILESYVETVSSPSVTYNIPAVARLKTKVPFNKKRVKFSRPNVYLRDNFTCQYCGTRQPSRKLNYDHVIPRQQGGMTVWENIVSSCYPCNSTKGNRTPEQARMHLLKRPTRPKELPLTDLAISLDKAPKEWLPYLSAVSHSSFG